jgi:hypothetical protein
MSMPNMTPQDKAMLKILQGQYGTKVYPSPPRATTADSARRQNAAKLAKKTKKK